jgi:6-phosphofructokinase 1
VDPNELIKKVKDAYSRKKFALVVVSEAVEMIDEEKNLGSGEVDQFGHTILKERGVGERIAKFIEKNTGIETRHAVIGHMQRGGEPTLFDRILATRVGIKAAELVRDGDFGKMAALCGNEIKAVPLKEATGQLKLVDNKWIEIMDILF